MSLKWRGGLGLMKILHWGEQGVPDCPSLETPPQWRAGIAITAVKWECVDSFTQKRGGEDFYRPVLPLVTVSRCLSAQEVLSHP